MPVKQVKSEKLKVKSKDSGQARMTNSASLRAPAKQSLKNQKVARVNKIATSSAKVRTPRNDEKVKKPVAKAKTTLNLSVPVFSLTGNSAGMMDLPKEIFGGKINQALLSQAMRVYLSNQKSHWSNTKTRGEVEGSTRKIFKQKGTGRARHGAIRAPIFVGGGIALGPKARQVVLHLPKKMKKAALISALSQKAQEKEVSGISGMEKASGKTREITSLISKIKGQKPKNFLFVIGGKMGNAQQALSNIPAAEFLSAGQLNAYNVIKHQSLFFTKDAVEKLRERLGGKQVKTESKA